MMCATATRRLISFDSEFSTGRLLTVNTTIRILLAFSFVLLTESCAPGEDWPQFRGPGGQGQSASRNLPVNWDSDTNVVWKTALPGNGWSSPVLSQGRIYLTTAVAGEQPDDRVSLRAVCLGAESGDLIWNVATAMLPADAKMHPKNSHASPTPIVTDDRVYVHFAAYGTAALNLDGDLIWQKQIEYEPQHGTGSSPVLFEDLLIFNCDGVEAPFVIALDAASGTERWRTFRPDLARLKFSFSTPLLIEVDGQPQLVSAGSDLVCGYDPRSGKQIWMVRYPEKWSVVPRPVFAGGLVLVCTGYVGPSELLAVRPAGEGDITDTHVVWRTEQFVPHSPSPVVAGSYVYLMSDNGIASCRDLATGDLLWKERVGGTYSASPVLAEDRIYFLSEDGLCTIIKAAPEFDQIAKNDLKERSLASMTPTDGALLIRTIEGLYRIGK